MSNDETTDPKSTAEAIPVPQGAANPGPAAAAEAAAGQGALPASSEAEAPAVSTAPAASTATTPAATAAAAQERSARTSILVLGRRLLRFAFAAALLGVGGYLGWQAYTANQPVVTIVGDPAVLGVPTPPAVAELAAAIAADDANAIRVALNAEMFSRYTADMERFGIATVDDVRTLGTYADGPRSATALVILGRTVDRNPFTINLVVIAQDGQIVRLR